MATGEGEAIRQDDPLLGLVAFDAIVGEGHLLPRQQRVAQTPEDGGVGGSEWRAQGDPRCGLEVGRANIERELAERVRRVVRQGRVTALGDACGRVGQQRELVVGEVEGGEGTIAVAIDPSRGFEAAWSDHAEIGEVEAVGANQIAALGVARGPGRVDGNAEGAELVLVALEGAPHRLRSAGAIAGNQDAQFVERRAVFAGKQRGNEVHPAAEFGVLAQGGLRRGDPER